MWHQGSVPVIGWQQWNSMGGGFKVCQHGDHSQWCLQGEDVLSEFRIKWAQSKYQDKCSKHHEGLQPQHSPKDLPPIHLQVGCCQSQNHLLIPHDSAIELAWVPYPSWLSLCRWLLVVAVLRLGPSMLEVPQDMGFGQFWTARWGRDDIGDPTSYLADKLWQGHWLKIHCSDTSSNAIGRVRLTGCFHH